MGHVSSLIAHAPGIAREMSTEISWPKVEEDLQNRELTQIENGDRMMLETIVSVADIQLYEYDTHGCCKMLSSWIKPTESQLDPVRTGLDTGTIVAGASSRVPDGNVTLRTSLPFRVGLADWRLETGCSVVGSQGREDSRESC